MITFRCSACQKNLSVKEQFAGKKGRCTGCGQPVTVPTPEAAPVAVPAGGSPPTLTSPPEAERDGPADRGGVPTKQTSAFATPQASPGRAGDELSLTRFLRPPLAEDELGRLGKYRILKIVGRGGMGVVFKADDPMLRRTVAVKAILPGAALNSGACQRFMREAQAMAAVKHDHIVTVYQVDEQDGVPFLAMEFLKGKSLEERLKGDQPFPLREVIRIAREVGEGLDAAHTCGLIHRDIKPANIWLEAPLDRVKILDFGLARPIAQEPGLTQEGDILGTPTYMAPEQARGEPVDAHCDLFSLGVVIYQLCTSRLPFHGKDTLSTMMEIALRQPAPPRELNPAVPKALSDLVMNLLEKKAELRPNSAAEVVEVLRGLQNKLDDAQEDEQQEADEPPPPRRRKFGRLPALLVGIALLSLLPLGWWLAPVLLGRSGPTGALVVEVDAPALESWGKGGRLTLTGPDGKGPFTLRPGERNAKLEPGLYQVGLEGADGLRLNPPQFSLKKGDTVTVRVTKDASGPAASQEPDRKAAEWALSVGGAVCVDGKPEQIKVLADLPRQPFRLTAIDLRDNNRVSNAGLANLAGCTGLTSLVLGNTPADNQGLAHLKGNRQLTLLDLSGTKVGDAGLASFKGSERLTTLQLGGTLLGDQGLANFSGCKTLINLNLASTRVSDIGLSHLKGCDRLQAVDLGGTPVGDAGVACFKACKNLDHLDLNHTQVGDVGLSQLRGCKDLGWLRLSGTKVTNAGMAHLKDFPKLHYVNLGRTQVGDLGLAEFKDCKSLTSLDLADLQVSDAGLAHFQGCKYLTRLWLNNTRVGDKALPLLKQWKGLVQLELRKTPMTPATIAELRKALPACRIEWDGGVVEPGQR